jgi:hypothetical protein
LDCRFKKWKWLVNDFIKGSVQKGAHGKADATFSMLDDDLMSMA